MECPEPYAHSFVVKVWLEETTEEAGRAMWRGRITHVHSGVRTHFEDLDEIKAFIVPYLQRMGAELDTIR